MNLFQPLLPNLFRPVLSPQILMLHNLWYNLTNKQYHSKYRSKYRNKFRNKYRSKCHSKCLNLWHILWHNQCSMQCILRVSLKFHPRVLIRLITQVPQAFHFHLLFLPEIIMHRLLLYTCPYLIGYNQHLVVLTISSLKRKKSSFQNRMATLLGGITCILVSKCPRPI